VGFWGREKRGLVFFSGIATLSCNNMEMTLENRTGNAGLSMDFKVTYTLGFQPPLKQWVLI